MREGAADRAAPVVDGTQSSAAGQGLYSVLQEREPTVCTRRERSSKENTTVKESVQWLPPLIERASEENKGSSVHTAGNSNKESSGGGS